MTLEVHLWNTNSEIVTHRMNLQAWFVSRMDKKGWLDTFSIQKMVWGFFNLFWQDKESVVGITVLMLWRTLFFFHIPTENHLKDKKTQTFVFLCKKWLWPKPIRGLKISASDVTTETFQT